MQGLGIVMTEYLCYYCTNKVVLMLPSLIYTEWMRQLTREERMLDLQARDGTPEPAVLVAGDEAELGLTVRDRARLALAENRKANAAYEKQQAEEERQKRNREAERIVKKCLGIDATAENGRVTLDGVTLTAYSHRMNYDYRGDDYLRLVAPCPYCGEETVGPNMATWGDVWAELGAQLERFTPDTEDHQGGACVRPSSPSEPPAKPDPTPAEKLTAALAEFIESVSQRYANE